MLYDVIIGLEIHVQLNTKSKMFCSCANLNEELLKEPNTTVCPICLGHPGTLPITNKQAVEWTILTGLALNCKVNSMSKFDRKHYFYPDLPKAYQISQYDIPLTYDGHLNVDGHEIKITRVHLEEDTGKLTHPAGKNYSLADYNRSSAPLMELVTEPVIKSAAEAKKFCQAYQQILRYLEISEADMEKGQMRCEANVSVQQRGKWQYKGNSRIEPVGNYKLNPKVELKNINSFKAVEKAVEYEIKRQTELLDEGGKIVQETRGWNENKACTVSQRSKEEAHDYRYFPEPDIPPLNIDQKWLKKIKSQLSELPEEKKQRFREQYSFSDYDAEILTTDKDVADYVEQVVSELRAWVETNRQTSSLRKQTLSLRKQRWEAIHQRLAKLTGNWVGTELFKLLKEKKQNITGIKITPENFAELMSLIYDKKVNSSAAQAILAEMFKTGGDPSDIMEAKGLEQMQAGDEMEKIIKDVIKKNPKAVEQYKSGKENAIQFLVGQVMAATKGKANPQEAKEMILKNIK